MNENPPINSGAKHSVSTHGNVGSGYFARIIADAARGLKIDQDCNDDQRLFDSLEQEIEQLNNNTHQTLTESPLSPKPVINGNNSTDTNIGPHNKTTQNAFKSERKSAPLQVREKLNKDVFAITPKHGGESRIVSKHEKVAELQSKNLYNQVQKDTAATPIPGRNTSDKASIPLSTMPDNYVARNINKNTENFRSESSETSLNKAEKITAPVAVQTEKKQLNYFPKQETQQQSPQAIQKMAAREPMKNTRAETSTSFSNKSAASQPKLHIGEVNIKVIDSAQGQQNSNTNAHAMQKTATTAATSKSAESRTFLRTL